MRSLKTVLITSLDGGVGKTTLSTVLSVAKGYTLVIDMDWEKADISQLFRAPKKAGWLAPYLKGGAPYVHRVSPVLYIIPGYEAFELYQKFGEDVVKDFVDILTEWVAYMPKFVQKLRLPVDTVVIDTAAALRVEVLAKLHGQGVFNIFMSDRRLISRISDVKTEQYRRYIAYSSLVVVNMVEKDELKMAKRIAPVALRRVSIDEYYSDAVTNSILRDRENRKAVSTILERIKLA